MGIADNLRVDPRELGISPLLCPGVLNNPGGRQDMVASHLPQARILDKPEFPHIFSGYEQIFGDYTLDSTRRPHRVKVIGVINKYDIKVFTIKPGNNPLRTVIYRDLETGEVGYFDIRKYSSYTNDFGYRNHQKTTVQTGDVISPDTEIYTSNAKKDGLYKMGINANVAYLTMLETTEDCFVVSRSMAEKMSPTSIQTKNIMVNLKRYPLNLYGDQDVFKIFPDLGDHVRPDGILCAWRPVRRFSAISDLQPHKLTQMNHIFDKPVYAHPGAQVIDVDVHLDVKADIPSHVYEQVKIYHEAHLNYWQQIVDIYETCKNLPITPKFNTLVTKAMGRLLAARRPVPGIGRNSKIQLMDKFSPVGLKIDITVGHKVEVNNGFKVSGRDGAKGVIIVRPDEEMPVDEQGFRADICIDPISVLKRNNLSQWFEAYINRLLKWQAAHLDQFGDVESQFQRVVEILTDINPKYAKEVVAAHPSHQQREQYVNECKADTIYICIPPGMDNLNSDMIQKLEEKYQTPISPVEFTIHTDNGTKRVKTKTPVRIGTKYLYLLSKYPKPISPGLGWVNQYHFPVNSKDKNESPLGTQPIKFGEAESKIFATATGVEPIMRLRGLYGNSRIGPKALVKSLMEQDQPSKMGRIKITTEELVDDNFAIRMAHHMFETCGINLCRSIITDEEAEARFQKIDNELEKP